MDQLPAQIGEIQRESVQIILAYLPRIVAALVLLLIGWIISWLLKHAVFRAVRRFNRWGALEKGLKEGGIHEITPRAIGSLVFWVSFLLFLASAVQVLGLPVVTGSLNRLAAYLPHLLAAVLVVAAGFILGNLVRAAVNRTARSAGLSQAGFLGETARTAVLLIASLIALIQAGIDSTVLVLVFGLLLGGAITGIALAFGFGARVSVGNLIAARGLGRSFSDNDLVRMGNVEGRIIKITNSAVIIQTEEGRAQVPARLFEESVVEILDQKD